MSEAAAKEGQGTVGQALVARARLFREEQNEYIQYADAARDSLFQSIESRLRDLKEEGVVGDTHDSLLNQLRGLRNRFAEVDAITRSLLLQIDENDPNVLEEILSFMAALYSLELEGRSVQKRVALAAVFRDYLGGHSVMMRNLSFDVDNFTAKRFHSLTNEIREIQNRVYGRQDPFTHKELFERAIALLDANKDLVARMGTPNIFNSDMNSYTGRVE